MLGGNKELIDIPDFIEQSQEFIEIDPPIAPINQPSAVVGK